MKDAKKEVFFQMVLSWQQADPGQVASNGASCSSPGDGGPDRLLCPLGPKEQLLASGKAG